jgi:hypothetical protein
MVILEWITLPASTAIVRNENTILKGCVMGSNCLEAACQFMLTCQVCYMGSTFIRLPLKGAVCQT